MKSILISIKPEWVAKILNGEKTIEIRKTAPKCELPIEVYIYCTKGSQTLMTYMPEDDYVLNGKVVAKFTLRKVENVLVVEWPYLYNTLMSDYRTKSLAPARFYKAIGCLSPLEIVRYGNVGKPLFAWHISDLEIFDKPKELSEFYTLKCNQKKEPCDIKDVFGVEECHELCKMCELLTKAPRSWCYVEEREE